MGSKRLAAFGAVLLAILSLAGCYSYRLYPALVDTSKYTKPGEDLNMAIVAVAKKKGKSSYGQGSVEHELAEKLATYIQEDIFKRKNKYKSLARTYEKKVPADFKPVDITFVDRQVIQQTMQEQDFGATDRVDQKSAVKIGEITGAQAMMFIEASMQVSGQSKDQVYERKKVTYMADEYKKNPKTGKYEKTGRKVEKTKYVKVPKRAGGEKVMRVSQRVRVKAEVKVIETATSKVIHSITPDSQIFEVSAEYREGEPTPKLNLRTAAIESLESLGHKIGRHFYPIMVGGLFGAPADPRTTRQDSLRNDLTWTE